MSFHSVFTGGTRGYLRSSCRPIERNPTFRGNFSRHFSRWRTILFPYGPGRSGFGPPTTENSGSLSDRGAQSRGSAVTLGGSPLPPKRTLSLSPPGPDTGRFYPLGVLPRGGHMCRGDPVRRSRGARSQRSIHFTLVHYLQEVFQ